MIFALLVIISVLVPQALFKRAERTPKVGPDGWSTKIGKKTAGRKWTELAPVREEDGTIIVANRGGNAMLIPNRAFDSEDQRKESLRMYRSGGPMPANNALEQTLTRKWSEHRARSRNSARSSRCVRLYRQLGR